MKNPAINQEDTFKQLATQRSRGGITSEFLYFVRSNKKWWFIPFLIPILLFGFLMLLAGTGAAPFIYTLF